MIKKLYLTAEHQLLVLLVMLFISSLIAMLSKFQPLLRANLRTYFEGVLFGVTLFILSQALIIAAGKYKALKKKKPANRVERPDLILAASAVLTKAVAEETLLRGFIFVTFFTAWSFPGSTLVGLVVNAALSFALYSDRKAKDYFAPLLGTVLACLYLKYHSLFLIIVARFAFEALTEIFSRFKLANKLMARLSRSKTVNTSPA